MFNKELTFEQFERVQKKIMLYRTMHPTASPTDLMRIQLRALEKERYGVSSHDLARGYEIDFVKRNDGQIVKLVSSVKGAFAVGGPGNGPGDEPVALFKRSKWTVDGKPMNVVQFQRDLDILKQIFK